MAGGIFFICREKENPGFFLGEIARARNARKKQQHAQRGEFPINSWEVTERGLDFKSCL